MKSKRQVNMHTNTYHNKKSCITEIGNVKKRITKCEEIQNDKKRMQNCMANLSKKPSKKKYDDDDIAIEYDSNINNSQVFNDEPILNGNAKINEPREIDMINIASVNAINTLDDAKPSFESNISTIANSQEKTITNNYNTRKYKVKYVVCYYLQRSLKISVIVVVMITLYIYKITIKYYLN
jgi:hypothetical protein